MNILGLLLKIGILQEVVFGKVIEGSGRFFEDCELGLMLIAFAPNGVNPALDVAYEGDASGCSPRGMPAGVPALNAFLDSILGVVFTNGFCTGKAFLSFGSE